MLVKKIKDVQFIIKISERNSDFLTFCFKNDILTISGFMMFFLIFLSTQFDSLTAIRKQLGRGFQTLKPEKDQILSKTGKQIKIVN